MEKWERKWEKWEREREKWEGELRKCEGVGKYKREIIFGSVVLCREMAIRGDH